MDLYLERWRRVGKVGQLEGQRCNDAFSSGQGLDIRHACLGGMMGGGVCPAWGADLLDGCRAEAIRNRTGLRRTKHTQSQLD